MYDHYDDIQDIYLHLEQVRSKRAVLPSYPDDIDDDARQFLEACMQVGIPSGVFAVF